MTGSLSVRIPARILLAIHGYEPAAWVSEAGAAVSMWLAPTVRVLAALDVPSPPFTSLTPFARRAYGEALELRREQEMSRLQVLLDELLPLLPASADLVYLEPRRRGVAAAISDHVKSWCADVVVIAPPLHGWRNWLWPGPVHQQLLRHLTCAVLITPFSAATSQPKERKVITAMHNNLVNGRT